MDIRGVSLDAQPGPTRPALNGPCNELGVGTVDLLDRACEEAEMAFSSIGWLSREVRAAFLRLIAAEINARGEATTVNGKKIRGFSW